MRYLFITGTPGPAEAMIDTQLRREGHRVFVYQAHSGWVRGSRPNFLWSASPVIGRSPLNARLLANAIQDHGIDQVMTSGLSGAGFASRHLSEPFLPILWRRDLDFAATRDSYFDHFRTLITSTDRLVLEDDLEMDKANSKGSVVAHLRHPDWPYASTEILTPAKQPKVLILWAEGERTEERRDAAISCIRSVLDRLGVPLDDRPVGFLYRYRDLAAGRDLNSVMRSRLQGYSHIVLLGTSRHSSSILRVLAKQLDRVLIEDTPGHRNWGRANGVTLDGKGVALAQNLLLRIARSSSGEKAREYMSTDGLAETLNCLTTRPVDSDMEELEALHGTGPLNVFFSVAPIEDRVDGARPQRIRNMAEALDNIGGNPAVRIYGNSTSLDRRGRTITRLLNEGRSAGVLYAENSTSPIADDVVRDNLGQFLEGWRRRGGSSTWFVRDFHWLDRDGQLKEPVAQREIVNRGLRELEVVREKVDRLAAPCDSSGRLFNELLARHGVHGANWFPLPPGVSYLNVVDPASVSGHEAGVTLLYAGGFNPVYAMPTYREALARLSQQSQEWRFDFVVRPQDARELLDFLKEGGVELRRVRVITTDLDNYAPLTQRCVGVILLESEYASSSFPYKTVSMIERGFPILTYRDSAIADFVLAQDVGMVCGRSADSLVATLREMVLRCDWPMAAAQQRMAWPERIGALFRADGSSLGVASSRLHENPGRSAVPYAI